MSRNIGSLNVGRILTTLRRGTRRHWLRNTIWCELSNTISKCRSFLDSCFLLPRIQLLTASRASSSWLPSWGLLPWIMMLWLRINLPELPMPLCLTPVTCVTVQCYVVLSLLALCSPCTSGFVCNPTGLFQMLMEVSMLPATDFALLCLVCDVKPAFCCSCYQCLSLLPLLLVAPGLHCLEVTPLICDHVPYSAL